MIDPIHAVKQGYTSLRPSEKKVADFVLQSPHICINTSIAELAKQAGVSEPTVIRFCKAIGYNGYQTFKLKLAQFIGNGTNENTRFAAFTLNLEDSLEDITRKVFDNSMREILRVKTSLNSEILNAAIQALASAKRVEFFGFGASGTVAQDAQHKFMRLKSFTFTHSDPHMQLISASTMTENDVVIAISQSGRSRELIRSIKQVKKNGAKIIGICADNTPLAEHCHFPLSVDAQENNALFTPLSSRIAHLVVIDVLATGVAVLKEPELSDRLNKIKQGLTPSKY